MSRMLWGIGCSLLWTLAGGPGLPSMAAEPSQAPPIRQLKPLHLMTTIVADGKPMATIVVPGSGCYGAAARRIVETCRELTGVELPICDDRSPAAQLPLAGHVIALGNRSTNPLVARLYDRYSTLLDLRYPGKGGYVVRTLHNPFGNGANVVFAGGSDASGVEAAVDVLVAALRKAHSDKAITLPWLAEIRLGEGITVPERLTDVETWEASAGYGSVGYFGWNSLSKRMALYYMTGDPVHAREFLRLAFPDEQAKREIAEIDGERIEDKDHPLSGPYHYNAHLMILYWDLIEESPVFSDEERLRVTQAFAQQLDHWMAEGYAARSSGIPTAVGSRHGQWAAVSLYCLARYFQTYYPHPVWKNCLDAGQKHFGSLHQYAWVSGEGDNLVWYNTAIAPVLTYMVLTGDRVPLENGVLATLLRGQEALISGRVPDWALNCAALDFLHKAAYLTQDGRWLCYRDRTGVDTNVFRVGQSFWPEEHLQPVLPQDLLGRWTIHRLPELKWKARASGLPLEESFEFGSFRSQPDTGGDFLLLDGFNGAYRNPYHTFTILALRLRGYTLLRDYMNQVLTRIDGLMEPKVAMDAALKRADVIGSTALAVGEVPNAAFANWRRTLAQRLGRYALVVDELTFRQASSNAEIVFYWQTERDIRQHEAGRILFSADKEESAERSQWGQVVMSDPVLTSIESPVATMRWFGPASQDERKLFFSLVGVQPDIPEATLECHRLSERSAILALPEPAEVTVREAGEREAELAVVAADHVFALAATRLSPLLEADHPVDVDWDLKQGTVCIAASEPTTVRLLVDPAKSLQIRRGPASGASGSLSAAAQDDKGGQVAHGTPDSDGMFSVALPAGRHRIEGGSAPAGPFAELAARLRTQLEQARQRRSETAAALQPAVDPELPAWTPKATAQIGAAVADLEIVSTDAGPLVAAAEGTTIHLLTLDGKETARCVTDGPIRLLRWWAEPQLLLAGCADEKVIAFDRAGQRRWAFVSEMDPAVYRAAKTYWFKSAKGHEGIHGLDVGAFLEGGTQAFVGSACTLEILDPEGRLLKRMPQFWGTVATFAIVDGPGGTKNLLAARKFNDAANAAIINSKTLDPTPRGFIAVPPGHTQIDGWSAMNHRHLFYEDLDGNGTREVISETNGVWNRIGVWDASGKPLASANLGPGKSIPAINVRDLDVGDLDGDGKKEILTATADGMAIALDATCQKRWAVRLPSPANVLGVLTRTETGPTEVVLGCDDGRVRVLDAQGHPRQLGTVSGQPLVLKQVAAGGAAWVILGTDKGEIAILSAEMDGHNH